MKKLILTGLFSIVTIHASIDAKSEQLIQFAQLAPPKPTVEKQKPTIMRENKKIMLNQDEVEKNAKQKQSSNPANEPQSEKMRTNRGYNDSTHNENPGLGHAHGLHKGKNEKDSNRFINRNSPNKIHRSNSIHMGVPTY